MNNDYAVIISTNCNNITKVYICKGYKKSVSKMKDIINYFQNGDCKKIFESIEVVRENKVIIKTSLDWYTVFIHLVENE